MPHFGFSKSDKQSGKKSDKDTRTHRSSSRSDRRGKSHRDAGYYLDSNQYAEYQYAESSTRSNYNQASYSAGDNYVANSTCYPNTTTSTGQYNAYTPSSMTGTYSYQATPNTSQYNAYNAASTTRTYVNEPRPASFDVERHRFVTDGGISPITHDCGCRGRDPNGECQQADTCCAWKRGECCAKNSGGVSPIVTTPVDFEPNDKQLPSSQSQKKTGVTRSKHGHQRHWSKDKDSKDRGHRR